MSQGKKTEDAANLPPPPLPSGAPPPPISGGMPLPPMPPPPGLEMPPPAPPMNAAPPPKPPMPDAPALNTTPPPNPMPPPAPPAAPMPAPAPPAAPMPAPAPPAAPMPPPAPPAPPAAPMPAPAPPAAPVPAPAPVPEVEAKPVAESDSALAAPTGLTLNISQEKTDLAPPVEALPPTAIEPQPIVEEDSPEQYSSLYAKKSGKPLQQVYGHIERIGSGEIGSLLERYSDRFGHELDRDIIVMRKGERDERLSEIRDSPTVELLNAEEDEEGMIDKETLVELNSQLTNVENELRRLKPEYQAAKEVGDRAQLRELRPSLESLMAERKMIKAVISGDAELDELLSMGEDDEEELDAEIDDSEEYEEEYEAEYDEEEESDDIFLDFVAIVDSLLGSNLPEDKIEEFTESEGFDVYRSVGSSPEDADEDMRKEFFLVVDALLGGMPDEAVSSFVESEEFETYRAIGAMYS